jgi:hypothetical protein
MFHRESWPIKVLLAAGVVAWLTACSSTPSTTSTTSTASAPQTQEAASAPAAPEPDTINGQPLSAERMLALQRAGYTFVDKDGQTYACRKETKTGSRLARETVCMTPAQADALRQETQRRLGEMMRSVPPPQGT